MTTQHHHRKSGSRTTLLAASMIYGMAAMTAAWADDTEIFFPPEVIEADDETARPNILFLMDTSGSMGSTDGTGLTRLQRVKDALLAILDDLNPSVNIGIGRLSSGEGGAILWPVAAIDSTAASVYPGLAAQQINISTGGGTNEAQQTSTAVVTTPGSLEVGEITATPPGNAEFFITRVGNEAEEYDNTRVDTDGGDGSRDSGDIELKQQNNVDPGLGNNRTTRYVGLRYEAFSLPAGATVTSAFIRFTCAGGGETSTLNNVLIRGHNVNFSDTFRRGNTDDVSDRYADEGTSNANNVTWNGVGGCSSAGTTVDTPNLASIVNQIRARSGWNDGNPITFLISLPSSGGQRTMRALQGGSQAVAPRLIVSFTQPAVVLGQRQFGLRFNNVNIPRGVTVTSAQILMYANPSTATATQNGQALSVNIDVEAADNAAAFTTTASNVSSRSSGGTVAWSVPVHTVAGTEAVTPSLTALVNGVTSRAGWCGGNSMVFRFSRSSGTGFRTFFSTASNAEYTPVLALSYSSGDAALDTGCQANQALTYTAANSDDAEESVSSTAVSLNSSDLELGFDGSTKQLVGMKFDNLNIPQGATIRSAYIEFRAKDNSSGTLNLNITGERADSAATFSASNSNVSGRLKTTASVNWAPGSWSSEAAYSTPDLTAVVQEIVNRAGWARGNEMAFYVSTTSNSNTRRAYSRDGSTSKAPKLVINYDSPPGRLTTRTYLKQVVNDFVAGGTTPLPEMLYEAAQYYRGDQVHYGKTRGDGDSDNSNGQNPTGSARISHPATIDYTRSSPNTEASLYSIPADCSYANYNSSTCANEKINGTAYYRSPLTEQECTTNNIVLLSDGLPNNTQNASITRMQSFIGKSCTVVPSDDGDDNDGTCGRELAEYLSTTDQSTALDGVQSVKTFTIGFANAGASDYLTSIAEGGGGEFYAANDAQGVIQAFKEIVAKILDISTTFVAPAVTVNTFNRLTNRDELYFALFRPQAETRWQGNLKRYKLGLNATTQKVEIQDATGATAVDPDTGFFKTTAKSFWNNVVDGEQIQQSGIIGRFTTSRNFYTYTGATSMDAGGATAPTAQTLSAAANKLDETRTEVTKAMLGDAAMSDAKRQAIIQFSRGLDINDDDSDGVTNEARKSLGDPLHSEPLLITYGGTEASPDITIFFGTNEGGLHAINASNGDEHFTFIPPELLPNLETYYENANSYTARPYGVDGLLSSLIVDPDGDLAILDSGGNIQTNNKAYLYAGLRMGGRQYYALDVTDRANPKLKFVIRGGGSGKYRELGQSWSRAVPAVIKFNGANRNVLIFTGGYDVAQDGKALPKSSVDTMGRAIFIADAITGERLWWGGIDPDALADNPDVTIASMQYSIPASPKVVDLDGDGLVDRLYVVDVAGQLYRIILNKTNTGSANLATARKIAQLGSDGTTANGRRFYSPPDVAVVRRNVSSPFIAISLGSGHRGHPLNKDVQDRFYVLRDPDVLVGNDTATLSITDVGTSNLYDATEDLVSSDDTDVAAEARTNLASSKGYYINFSDTVSPTGEKVLTESQTFNNQVFFATFEPGGRAAAATCQASSGLSRFYILDVVDGSATADLYEEDDEENTTRDRYKELAQGGLPPDPTILFPGIGGTLPQEALICIGPECFNPGLDIETEKTFWIKRQ